MAISRYNDRNNSYRIYTNAFINGKNICLGVDVNQVGKEVFVSDIVTAYGRNLALIIGNNNETLLYPTEQELKQTLQQFLSAPKQQTNLLSQQGYAQASVSNGKVTTNKSSDQIVPSQKFSIAGQPQLMPNETIGEYAARYNSWLEQERDKDIFDLYAKEYMRRKSRLTGKERLSDRFEEFFYNAELTIENFQYSARQTIVLG